MAASPASRTAMAASGIVDALTWIEEPRTRDAFLTLIGRQHIIGGDPTERLPVLFEESVAAAEEITEALGSQVRSAMLEAAQKLLDPKNNGEDRVKAAAAHLKVLAAPENEAFEIDTIPKD